MRLSETQKVILSTTSAQSKVTSGDLGLEIGLPAGPCARSLNSLVNLDLMKVTCKSGVCFYSRTAAGGKLAKKF